MNEITSLASFIGFFSVNYPVIIPVLLGVAYLVVSVLDWFGMWVRGYVDDWEGSYPLKVVPKIHRWLTVKTNTCVLYVGDDRPRGFQDSREMEVQEVLYNYTRCYAIKTGQYWHYAIFDNKATAEKFLKKKGDGVEWTRACRRRVVDVIPVPVVIFLYLSGLMVGLIAYKYLPTFTLTLVGVLGVAWLARMGVRLGKKLQSHINNPDAHKGDS